MYSERSYKSVVAFQIPFFGIFDMTLESFLSDFRGSCHYFGLFSVISTVCGVSDAPDAVLSHYSGLTVRAYRNDLDRHFEVLLHECDIVAELLRKFFLCAAMGEV